MRGRWDKEPGQSSRQPRRLCREKGVAKGVRGGRERGETEVEEPKGQEA